jgi:cell division protein FtsQ
MIRGLLLVFWIALSVGALFLLISAIETKNVKPCKGYHITVEGTVKGDFIDQKDVLKILTGINGSIKGKPMKEFDLKKMEEGLEKNPWIDNAELYFDNNRELQVKVREKEPVARIFTSSGTSFYIDSTLDRMPLNEKFTPRLPVFTNFPSDKKVLKGKDSMLMKELKDISVFLLQDSFWMAQIDQVEISPAREFEMVPKVGNHTVIFGNGEGIETKFRKLYIFYDEVLNRSGWNKYSAVNLSYHHQVVATRKDMKSIRADTLLARQWVRQMIKNTRDLALADSARKKAIAAGITAAIADASGKPGASTGKPASTTDKPASAISKPVPASGNSVSESGKPSPASMKPGEPVKKAEPSANKALQKKTPAAKPAEPTRKPKAVMQTADDNKKVTTTSLKEQQL